MNQETFNRIVDERCRLIKSVLASKAKEYARGDRLHNFKRAAGFMNKTAETACWGFGMKHLTSIADIVDDLQDGVQPTPDMAREKLGDAINYLILLEALLEERFATPVNGFGNFVESREVVKTPQSKRRSK